MLLDPTSLQCISTNLKTVKVVDSHDIYSFLVHAELSLAHLKARSVLDKLYVFRSALQSPKAQWYAWRWIFQPRRARI